MVHIYVQICNELNGCMKIKSFSEFHKLFLVFNRFFKFVIR